MLRASTVIQWQCSAAQEVRAKKLFRATLKKWGYSQIKIDLSYMWELVRVNQLKSYLNLEDPYRRLHRSNKTTFCSNVSQKLHLVPSEQIVKLFCFKSLLLSLSLLFKIQKLPIGATIFPKHLKVVKLFFDLESVTRVYNRYKNLSMYECKASSLECKSLPQKQK